MVLSQAKPATRDLILDATDRLISRFGYRKMTMDDVAKEAGISKRTIYTYFATKEDVGLSLLRRVVERINLQLDEILLAQISYTEKLARVLFTRTSERIVGVKDYSQCMDEIFEIVRPRYIAQRQELFASDQAMLADLLEDGKKAGEFEFADAAATAAALLTMTGSYLPYSLSVKEMGDLETIKRSLQTAVDLLVAGVTSQPNKR